MIKIGIVGCGMITKTRHAPEYGHHKDAKIVAWYNRSVSKAKELSNLYGGRVYETFDELLESDVDALSICSFNSNHYEQTIKALNAGKHVLVEKPMAMSLKECEDMVTLA
ncbi:MAG: Gfo/Idh/MocA family oxidoreductase, partial [Erysipelotrichaceae bacterium]|nr:Gfo/Idh/MocA family oxidoreductase [Erysipelotrichaceae bacterium]